MRILAIETTGRQGSLAALQGELPAATPLREVRLDGGRTAQMLAPMLQALLAEVGWSARSVELVAVAVGPGSFTGLRIGVTTAKTFAYSVGANIVAIETMDALAAQAGTVPAPLWTIIDAQRQELFVAKYLIGDTGPVRQIETAIMPQDDWLAALQPGDHVSGPFLARLRTRLPAGVVPLSDEVWQPLATAVGQVGWQSFQQGQRDDVWKLAPKYLRLSAAEEKAASKS